MNRAMRRLAGRQKPIGPGQIMPLPSLLDEWTVFNGVTTMLHKLASGEIEAINGKPVFRGEKGEWCEVCPALSGWISCWERFDRVLDLQLVQDPLAKLHNKLHYGTPLTHADIEAAQEVVSQQRKLFRKLDRSRLAELAKTEQIALYLER